MYKKHLITLFAALFAIFGSINTASADMVVTPETTAVGRIHTVASGMIILNENRSDLTFKRSVKNDYFEDAVAYKKFFFSKKVYELTGRVESMDKMNAVVYTPHGKVEIQRYKIKNIVMKVPNRGY